VLRHVPNKFVNRAGTASGIPVLCYSPGGDSAQLNSHAWNDFQCRSSTAPISTAVQLNAAQGRQ
jgi:hypothetical protein